MKLKADLHLHTADDPVDTYINYTSEELIDQASARGFEVLAITLHGKRLERPEVFAHAERRGILLIPAIEKFIEERDVLIYNVSAEEVRGRMNFSDLRRLREKRGNDILIIAPHPYFPHRHSLREKLEPHIDLFDALEYAHLYLPFLNYNIKGEQTARIHDKPMIANSDTHHPTLFGDHYSYLDATDKSIPAVFDAIRQGRIEMVHRPRYFRECAYVGYCLVRDKVKRTLGLMPRRVVESPL